MRIVSLTALILTATMLSCSIGNTNGEEEEIRAVTPVTITSITKGTLSDTVILNATSSFMIKTSVNASINGYLDNVTIIPGQYVKKGQRLFTIRSKEGSTLGNTINNVDSSFNFTGITTVVSPADGYITQLYHLPGEYILEGESLASLSNDESLVFLLNLPYELKPYLKNNMKLLLNLPDGQKIKGTVSSSLPYVDAGSQTQSYILLMDQYRQVPENLIATVSFVRNTKKDAVSLPKEAVLADEEQTEFWIMKLADSTTAVKIPIIKGLETTSRVEILSPELRENDIILLTGNYGLPDTAKIVIEKNR